MALYLLLEVPDLSESDPAPIVSEAYATGEEISPIITRLETALEGEPRTHALMALCSMMVLLQHPGIGVEDMYDAVRDISRYTCMWLTGITGPEADLDLEGGEIPKEKMN